jgi:hypothetical protein
MTQPRVPASFEAMEQVYDQLAAAIDRAGSDDEARFLTRLVLVMAHRAGPALDFAACIAVAASGEPPSTRRNPGAS